MNDQSGTRGASSLIGDILTHLSNLVRKEVDLARSEIGENLNRAAVAIGLLVGAVVIALTALNVLAAALVVALAELGLEPVWASLIVGTAFAALALAMSLKGARDLKLSSITPSKTVENVRRDAELIKEKIHDRP